MNRQIIESRVFTARVNELLDATTYTNLQNLLVTTPDKGDVIPGCGGLRKLRVENPRRGKGKRGGCRVVHLHVPEVQQLHLLAIYSKDEQDDLTAAQKKVLKALEEQTRREACRRHGAKGTRQK